MKTKPAKSGLPKKSRSRAARRGGARRGAGRPRADDEAILEACRALVEKQGYGRLSFDDVAARAGVAKTTLYRRWPSKPLLVAAAVSPLFASTLEPPDRGSLRADLLALAERSREMMLGRPGRLLRTLVCEAHEHPELDAPLQEELHRRRKICQQVLVRAVARGELRPEVDHDLVAELLMGPSWARSLISPGPMPPELPAQVVELLLRGVERPHRPTKGKA